jgi:hypothetical protein
LNKINKKIGKNLLKEIDTKWQKYILTYAETRNEFGRMDPPILSIVKKGNYDKIDSEILAKKGQAKPLLVTENFNYRNKFEVLESYGF